MNTHPSLLAILSIIKENVFIDLDMYGQSSYFCNEQFIVLPAILLILFIPLCQNQIWRSLHKNRYIGEYVIAISTYALLPKQAPTEQLY